MKKITTDDLVKLDNGHSYRIEMVLRKKEFEKMRIGTRVVNTIYSIGNGLFDTETFGKYCGLSTNGRVKIKVNGKKTIGFYSLIFWKPCKNI